MSDQQNHEQSTQNPAEAIADASQATTDAPGTKTKPEEKKIARSKAVNSNSLVVRIRRQWPFIVSFIFMLFSAGLLYQTEMERVAYISAREELEIRKQKQQTAETVSFEDILLLDEAFLDEEEVIGFIEDLEQARSAFSSYELNFTSETPQGKSTKYLTFELSVAGPVSNITALLTALNDGPYVFEATNMQLSSGDGFRNNATMTLIATLYIADQ